MNGGAVGGLFDCHGNWTAAIALMDHSSLPKPPLTLTTQVLVRPSFQHVVSVHICRVGVMYLPVIWLSKVVSLTEVVYQCQKLLCTQADHLCPP